MSEKNCEYSLKDPGLRLPHTMTHMSAPAGLLAGKQRLPSHSTFLAAHILVNTDQYKVCTSETLRWYASASQAPQANSQQAQL